MYFIVNGRFHSLTVWSFHQLVVGYEYYYSKCLSPRDMVIYLEFWMFITEFKLYLSHSEYGELF